MARLGEFLGKQGRFLLENDNQALIYCAILALIPFAGWLSAAVVALVTLRKGLIDGFKCLVAAFLVLLALSLMTMSFTAAFISAALAFLPCYLTAAVLHSTASWKVTVASIVFQALLLIVLIHWLAPEFITNQFQYIQTILKGFEREFSDNPALALASNQTKQQQTAIANYLLGVQATSIVISALASLMLARSVQSRIFYPGGFRQEMLGFQASSLGIVLLGIAVFGAYNHSLLAISCLPILVTYYVFAGLGLTFSLTKTRGPGTFVLLFVPLIILPFVMLPIYVILGALDSLFNFRSYLSKTDGKQNKG
ncbi:MAG: DUF2232 domain-containing protein [Tatlockia sp.]|nr:DUF2232 domain-containing protein [Tatlockia sp.]